MCSCMFLSMADVSLGQSTAFGLALSSLALLGVGRRGSFYSHIVYTCSLGQLASAKCFFCLTLCIPTTLDFWANTWGLCSVLEGSPFYFWCMTFSWGGSAVAREFSFTVYSAGSAEIFLLPDPLIISEVSDIVTGLFFSSSLVCRGFLVSCFSQKGSLFSQGYKNLTGDWSVPASDVLLSLLPAFLFCCSVTKKLSWYIFPDIRRA